MPSSDRGQPVRAQLQPTAHEALLLAAAFAPDGEFDARFAAWADAVGEQPAPATYALAQLLAPRLRERHDAMPLAALCRRQYRLVWAKTRLLERRHAAILARFADTGIASLVLKGPALQPLYYRDPGMRAMGDLDLLVPPERFHEAMAWFLNDGWRAQDFAVPHRFDIRFGRAIGLIGKAGDLIDLHAHAFHQQGAWTAAPALFWAEARRFDIVGTPAFTLSPEHHLIHQIEHAIADRERNSRWIADGMMLIRSGLIDWARLADHAAILGLHRLVVEGLLVLRAFGAAIPDHALAPPPGDDRPLDEAWHAIDSSVDRLRFHAAMIGRAAHRTGRRPLALVPAYLRFLAARQGMPWRRGRHELTGAPSQ